MACYHPIPAWRMPGGNVVLREPLNGKSKEYLRLPCGSCLGCRMSRAREWALRCKMESQIHDYQCWCTLTYDEAHVPITLEKLHVSEFMRQLRKAVFPVRVRFFASGEYGERTLRPHYHVILFGLPQYAEAISASWSYGFVRVDPLSEAAISYVAGYASKKIGLQFEREERVDYETGEVFMYQPPFVLMSRKPGIGGHAREFVSSWRKTAIFNGSPIPVPRFLHQAWKDRATPEMVEALLLEKQRDAALRDTSRPRLLAAEQIAQSRQALSADRRSV